MRNSASKISDVEDHYDSDSSVSVPTTQRRKKKQVKASKPSSTSSSKKPPSLPPSVKAERASRMEQALTEPKHVKPKSSSVPSSSSIASSPAVSDYFVGKGKVEAAKAEMIRRKGLRAEREAIRVEIAEFMKLAAAPGISETMRKLTEARLERLMMKLDSLDDPDN